MPQPLAPAPHRPAARRLPPEAAKTLRPPKRLDHSPDASRLREADLALGSAALAEAIVERFGIRVHPRSVERALARAAGPKSGGGQQ